MEPEQAIIDALLWKATQLDASLTGFPFEYPNTSFIAPSDGKYISVSYLPNRTESPFTGGADRPNYHYGILQLSVYFPAKTGIIQPISIASQIVSYFDRAVIERNDVVVRIYQRPWYVSPIQESDRVMVPVSIPYRCYI